MNEDIKYRCFHCKQVFDENTAPSHFGKSPFTTEMARCVEILSKEGKMGDPYHEPWYRVRKDYLATLEHERDEAREELSIWKSVFPDIAPESVQPDRSRLEAHLAEAVKVIKLYRCDCQPSGCQETAGNCPRRTAAQFLKKMGARND